MLVCPRTNTPEWQKFVKDVGEDNAWRTVAAFQHFPDAEVVDMVVQSFQEMDKAARDAKVLSKEEKQWTYYNVNNLGATDEIYADTKAVLGLSEDEMYDLSDKLKTYNPKDPMSADMAYFAFMLLTRKNPVFQSEVRHKLLEWERYEEFKDTVSDDMLVIHGIVKDKNEWNRKHREMMLYNYFKETKNLPKEVRTTLDAVIKQYQKTAIPRRKIYNVVTPKGIDLMRKLQSAGLVDTDRFNRKGTMEYTVRMNDNTKSFFSEERVYTIEENKKALEEWNNTKFGGLRVIEVDPMRTGAVVRINEGLLNSIREPLAAVKSEERKSIDPKLQQFLVKFMAKFGVKVEAVDRIVSKYGELDGIADMLHKLIQVAKGMENTEVLTEEVGHIVFEMIADTKEGKRILELISDTPKYREVVLQYGERYKNDDFLLRREAAGQLLGEAIVEQWEEDSQNPIIKYLKSAWNWVKSLFRAMDYNTARNELQQINRGLARDVLTENVSKFNEAALDTDLQLAAAKKTKATKAKSTSKIDDAFEKQVREAVEITYKKVKVFTSSGNVRFINKEEKRLEDLLDALRKGKNVEALMDFASSVRGDAEGIVNMAVKLAKNPIANVFRSSTRIKNAWNYAEAYRSLLKSVIAMINENPDLANDPRVKQLKVELVYTSGELESTIETIQNAARPILASVFKMFEGSRGIGPDGKPADIDWVETMKVGKQDISWWQRWLDAAADASDEVIQIVDKIVKNFKDEARHNTIQATHKIVAAHKELEKAGFTPEEIVAEKFEGKATGNWVSKFNRAAFEKSKKDFAKQLRKDLGLPELTDEELKNLPKDERLPDDKSIRKQWADAWIQWYEENEEDVPNIEERIAEKKAWLEEQYEDKEEAEIAFDRWLKSVRKVSGYHNQYINYRGELRQPTAKYINPQWKELTDKNNPKYHPAKQAYYEAVFSLNTEAVNKMPLGLQGAMRYKLPQVRKEYLERAKGKGLDIGGQFKEAKTSLIDEFVRNESDTEFGMYHLTNEKRQIANRIPIHYVHKIDKIEDLSMDISATTAMLFATTENYHQLNKVVHTLELAKDIMAIRQYEKRDSFGKLLQDPVKFFKDKDARILTHPSEGTASNVYKRLEDYFNMQIYGNMKKDEGRLFNTNLDQAKVIDLMGRYVSINNLAFNLYSGISNITVGKSNLVEEAISREYFGKRDLAWAMKEYAKQLATGGLLELGQREKTNKLHLWNEYFDTFEDFETVMRGLNLHSNSVLGQALSGDAMYAINSAGEHELQSTLSLALSRTIKFDKNKKPIWKNQFEGTEKEWAELPSLYEVMEVEGTNLVPKKGYEAAVKDVRFLFKNRFSKINHDLNGIYNEIDRAAAQHSSYGRLALQFRKWIRPGWNRRWRKQTYYESSETWNEGFYYTAAFKGLPLIFNSLKDGIQGREFSFRARYEQLTPNQRANLWRAISEITFIIASAVLIHVLKNLSDDDEDNWALNMLAYQANRYYTEMRFWTSVDEGLKILKSPAAAINQWQNLIDFISVIDWIDWENFELEVIKSGPNKGKTRMRRSAEKVVPFWRTVERLLHPEEQLSFYTNKY